MKHSSMLLLFYLLVAAFPLDIHSQVNVITYNIRYNNPGDGEHAWPNRKDDVINLLKFHQADIFCLQEALEGQVKEVDAAFPDFTYVGVGRDDGKSAGEYAPVFYNAKRFAVKDAGHFWLSEDPEHPSKGWDAAIIRICSWVHLEERSTGRALMVFNTHFDHVGTQAREKSADLIIQKIGQMRGDNPVVLCGDFNLPPSSEPMRKLAAYLDDAYQVTELPPHGATGTWSGFTYEAEKGDRIDYIFVSDDLRVKRYAALTDSRDKSFFSDHLPVFVEIGWR